MPKNKKFKPDPAQTMGSFSKNLLGLKFMQRAKKEVDKIAEEKDESFDTSLGKSIKNKQKYIINPSYQFCERLRFGRLSFKGMNTEIENMMWINATGKESASSNKRSSPPSASSSDNEIDSLGSENEDDNEDGMRDTDDEEEESVNETSIPG